jgi:thiol:disulfide interchange protein DsbD|tara:strand:+ start:2881 stop:4950 length:2070 start_codon:yes stop_codon:yes gene_type:complete
MIKKYTVRPYKNIISKLSLLLIFTLCLLPSVQGESIYNASDSSLKISSNYTAIEPGDSLTIGLEFKLNDGWHTYWKNPGDAGGAASIEWDLPKGFTASEILWPGPDLIPVEPLMTFGYEDEVTLLSTLASTGTASFPAYIKAKVSWYTCKDICIPQEGEVEIVINQGAQLPSKQKIFLSSVSKKIPTNPAGPIRVELLDDNYYVQATIENPDSLQSAYFFPEEYGVISYTQKQNLIINDKNISLEIKPAEVEIKRNNFKGVLRIDREQQTEYFVINERLRNLPALGSVGSVSILTAIFFAFLGGLILNIMPCVFPILSIKILSFVEQSEGSKRKMAQHGLAFSGGVLITFLSIAGLLLLLKAGGESIGWGYQLQSPFMVSLLIYLFVAIGIVFMSNLVIGAQLSSLGNLSTGHNDVVGSFLTGVLAVIVASPCTAPFMGSALGVALLQPGLSSIAIFISLGLGFAAPYLLLSLSPGLLRYLPKPGEWMENLKQFMAFPMWGSALWLTWVLSGQVSTEMVLVVLIGALFIGLSLWLFEKTQGTTGSWKLFFNVIALSLIAMAIYLAPTQYDENTQADQSEITYSQESLNSLLASNQRVFLNFTADWCITCKVNERVALERESVKEALKGKDIKYLKADWTRKDSVIANKLGEYGRTGVPLYLMFPSEGEPIILPELLTEDILLDYIKKLE